MFYPQTINGGCIIMKNVVLNEITNELNWKERIVVNMFTKTFIKVYNVTRIRTINILLR